MDIRELEKLAIWFGAHFGRFGPLYQTLISPIQHNATQPQKVAVEEPLNDLLRYLLRMDFEVLSIQQLKLLDKLQVSPLLGYEGAEFVESVVRTANYDPTTASSELNEAYNNLSNVKSYLDAYLQSLAPLDLRELEADEDFITIRVSFQNDASINNVADWKKASADWHDIIRGLALAKNEAPEATRILGATTGSIIMIFAGTAGVTELLARISKNITSVAKDVLELMHIREDLKQKKVLTKLMEQELNRQADEKKVQAVEAIMLEIKPLLADDAGDKIPALTKSVEKLLAFNEKGGTVDFVAPETDDEEEEDGATASPSSLSAVKQAIRQYQEVREQVKLLSYEKKADDGK